MRKGVILWHMAQLLTGHQSQLELSDLNGTNWHSVKISLRLQLLMILFVILTTLQPHTVHVHGIRVTRDITASLQGTTACCKTDLVTSYHQSPVATREGEEIALRTSLVCLISNIISSLRNAAHIFQRFIDGKINAELVFSMTLRPPGDFLLHRVQIY